MFKTNQEPNIDYINKHLLSIWEAMLEICPEYEDWLEQLTMDERWKEEPAKNAEDRCAISMLGLAILSSVFEDRQVEKLMELNGYIAMDIIIGNIKEFKKVPGAAVKPTIQANVLVNIISHCFPSNLDKGIEMLCTNFDLTEGLTDAIESAVKDIAPTVH